MNEVFKEWIDQVYQWLLTNGARIVLIAFGSYILNKVTNKFIEKTVKIAIVTDKSVSLEARAKRETTLIRIFTLSASIIIMVVAVMMILQLIGVPIGPIITGAGILGLAFGFGGQYLIRDIISGFFIILENQYRIGDVVDFDGTSGLVESLSLRMTTLRDLDGTVHHIPHGEIKKVANLSKYFSRINMNIGISYNTKLDHVIKVINQVGQSLSDDPKWKEDIIKPPQFLRVDDFADSAIIIKILGETRPLKQWDVAGELRKRIKLAFDNEGIEIPFPQRVIHHVTK